MCREIKKVFVSKFVVIQSFFDFIDVLSKVWKGREGKKSAGLLKLIWGTFEPWTIYLDCLTFSSKKFTCCVHGRPWRGEKMTYKNSIFLDLFYKNSIIWAIVYFLPLNANQIIARELKCFYISKPWLCDYKFMFFNIRKKMWQILLSIPKVRLTFTDVKDGMTCRKSLFLRSSEKSQKLEFIAKIFHFHAFSFDYIWKF